MWSCAMINTTVRPRRKGMPLVRKTWKESATYVYDSTEKALEVMQQILGSKYICPTCGEVFAKQGTSYINISDHDGVLQYKLYRCACGTKLRVFPDAQK